jgi:hypothetical protein
MFPAILRAQDKNALFPPSAEEKAGGRGYPVNAATSGWGHASQAPPPGPAIAGWQGQEKGSHVVTKLGDQPARRVQPGLKGKIRYQSG